MSINSPESLPDDEPQDGRGGMARKSPTAGSPPVTTALAWVPRTNPTRSNPKKTRILPKRPEPASCWPLR